MSPINSAIRRSVHPFPAGLHPGRAGLATMVAILALLILRPLSTASADGYHEALRSQLLTLDGEVVALGTTDGEGSLVLVTATLRSQTKQQTEWRLLLAPQDVLEEVGFEISEGDHLRARVFPDPSGSHLVHKVWNVETRNDIRLRTLYRVPVWDNDGEWQGSQRADCPFSPWQQDPVKDPEPPPDEGSSIN